MKLAVKSKVLLISVGLILAAASMSFGRDFKVQNLTIQHPWARATPKGAEVGGGYLTIKNNGHDPDRLIGGSCDFAGSLEIHEMASKDGIMTMRPLPNGLEIKPGASVELKPGSLHIMFQQLKRPLKKGDLIKATLTFEKAGDVPVEFVVEAMGAKSGGNEPMDMPMD